MDMEELRKKLDSCVTSGIGITISWSDAKDILQLGAENAELVHEIMVANNNEIALQADYAHAKAAEIKAKGDWMATAIMLGQAEEVNKQLKTENQQFSIEVDRLVDILTSQQSVDHAIADLALNKWRKIEEEIEKLKEKLKEYGCHKAGCTANGPGGCNCGLLQAQGLLQASKGKENEKLKELLETRTVPVGTPHIVCLCGSTRFYRVFQEANYKETMKGNIVLSVGFYPHAQEEMHGENLGITSEQKAYLDTLHLRKIDLADSVFVLNVGGYIGESTAKEIEYAESKNKPIGYLEP